MDIKLSNQDYTCLVKHSGEVILYRGNLNNRLFELLKEWRYNLSKILNTLPFYIFRDVELQSIANALPITKDMLWLVEGFKNSKIDNYGDEIVNLVNSFLKDYDIVEVLYGRYAFNKNNSRIKYILRQMNLLDYFR